jgi:hypothetical protein
MANMRALALPKAVLIQSQPCELIDAVFMGYFRPQGGPLRGQKNCKLRGHSWADFFFEAYQMPERSLIKMENGLRDPRDPRAIIVQLNAA